MNPFDHRDPHLFVNLTSGLHAMIEQISEFARFETDLRRTKSLAVWGNQGSGRTEIANAIHEMANGDKYLVISFSANLLKSKEATKFLPNLMRASLKRILEANKNLAVLDEAVVNASLLLLDGQVLAPGFHSLRFPIALHNPQGTPLQGEWIQDIANISNRLREVRRFCGIIMEITDCHLRPGVQYAPDKEDFAELIDLGYYLANAAIPAWFILIGDENLDIAIKADVGRVGSFFSYHSLPWTLEVIEDYLYRCTSIAYRQQPTINQVVSNSPAEPATFIRPSFEEVRIPSSLAEELLEITGGHPDFVQRICAEAYEDCIHKKTFEMTITFDVLHKVIKKAGINVDAIHGIAIADRELVAPVAAFTGFAPGAWTDQQIARFLTYLQEPSDAVFAERGQHVILTNERKISSVKRDYPALFRLLDYPQQRTIERGYLRKFFENVQKDWPDFGRKSYGEWALETLHIITSVALAEGGKEMASPSYIFRGDSYGDEPAVYLAQELDNLQKGTAEHYSLRECDRQVRVERISGGGYRLVYVPLPSILAEVDVPGETTKRPLIAISYAVAGAKAFSVYTRTVDEKGGAWRQHVSDWTTNFFKGTINVAQEVKNIPTLRTVLEVTTRKSSDDKPRNVKLLAECLYVVLAKARQRLDTWSLDPLLEMKETLALAELIDTRDLSHFAKAILTLHQSFVAIGMKQWDEAKKLTAIAEQNAINSADDVLFSMARYDAALIQGSITQPVRQGLPAGMQWFESVFQMRAADIQQPALWTLLPQVRELPLNGWDATLGRGMTTKVASLISMTALLMNGGQNNLAEERLLEAERLCGQKSHPLVLRTRARFILATDKNKPKALELLNEAITKYQESEFYNKQVPQAVVDEHRFVER